jgi:hypothetical protein
MDTITTAIASDNPKLVKNLVAQGFLVGPNEVKNLLNRTAICKSPQILDLRLEMSQLLIDLQSIKPMSFTKLQSLPHNHIDSPMGPMQKVEDKFLELCGLWEAEVS